MERRKPVRASCAAPRYRRVARCVLAVVIALSLSAGASFADETPRVPAAEAGAYVGRTATVCGRVMSASHIGSVRGGPTFLNLGKAYPDQVFTVVIWNQNRGKFERPPERMFDGREICVTGKIQTYKGTPQIEVTEPAQISLVEPALGKGKLTDPEGLLVKALLASLGYDLDYGTAAWDQETVAAVVAFQEDSGLEPTGNMDSPTMRALANAVPDISEDDKELVIRLVLFEAVRRWE
ncbi:MAG: hypothetical protein GF405_01495 [Candidatus Eisenbacteria bacterium]|nr:hypothetical protein [Candidatus Eisenbacteria bacterium]